MRKIILFNKPILAKLDDTDYGYNLVYGYCFSDADIIDLATLDELEHAIRSWVSYANGRQSVALSGGKVTCSPVTKKEVWTFENRVIYTWTKVAKSYCNYQMEKRGLGYRIVDIEDGEIPSNEIQDNYLLDRERWLDLQSSGCPNSGCE